MLDRQDPGGIVLDRHDPGEIVLNRQDPGGIVLYSYSRQDPGYMALVPCIIVRREVDSFSTYLLTSPICRLKHLG